MDIVEKSSMEELSKVGIDSKRTTAASVAIVGLVVYLSMIHLQSILMPLAIAVLLFFMIKPPEQFIYEKVGNRFVSYGTVLLTFIVTVYFTSLFLYCLLYTSPSPRDSCASRMPSSA